MASRQRQRRQAPPRAPRAPALANPPPENLRRGEFVYVVPWDSVPTSLIEELEAFEANMEPAHPDLQQRLKKWIARDLYNAYEEFKTTFVARTKTPGMAIYRSVTTEVIGKFKYSFKVIIEGVELDDGYETFLECFSTSMENRGRGSTPVARVVPQARLARGQVVVEQEMYSPPVEEEEEQTAYKTRLLEIYRTVRASNWPTLEIDEKMHKSYALQRQDILNYATVNEIDDEDEESEDNPQGVRQIAVIRRHWPFLFETKWQARHFQQLIGTTIDTAIQDFTTNYSEMLMDYLTSCGSDSSMRNVILRRQWQRCGSNMDSFFLMLVKMIANHFQEHEGILYISAEKTTLPSEVQFLPTLSGDPTIVALDSNSFAAKKFYACIDQQVVVETKTSVDAVAGLIMGAFIFDSHYPHSLKHTYEYLERVVCRLGTNTMVARAVNVTTRLVLGLVNDLRKFQEKYELQLAQM